MGRNRAAVRAANKSLKRCTDALAGLGLPPPGVHVRIALRRRHWSRDYLVPLALIQMSLVVAALVVYVRIAVWFAETTLFVNRLGRPDPATRESSANYMTHQVSVNPIALFAFVFLVVLIGLSAFWMAFIVCAAIPYGIAARVWRFGANRRRLKASVFRQTALIGRVHAVILAADRVRTQGSRKQAQNVNELFRTLSALKRQVGRAHQSYAVTPFTRRARRLREHQRLVVAAVEKAESQLDQAPLCALTPLVELVLKIADRHTKGWNAALLPEEDLQGLTPARDWEPLRMIAAAVFMAGTAVAVAFFDLPDPAITALLGTAGLVAVSILYGRGARSAFDVVDIVRGQSG
ncbi:hypothetical protein ABZY10_37890 [Streptomyces sp. NPDC006539]|uniref:hypothetical protein n=1 Tax=Streptomyces sp. NPDC006539 TaxID=3155352 RepID=UPI0033B946CB